MLQHRGTPRSSFAWRPIWRIIAAVALALPLLPALAAGQLTCTINSNGQNKPCDTPIVTTFSLTVPRVVQLTLSASTLALTSGPVSASDYETGSIVAGSVTATARADTGAVVTMAAATTNFTAPAGVTKAASTLQASLDGGLTWNGLTTGGAQIVSIGSGGSAGTAKSISFRTLIGYTSDPPGSYSLMINFTVTAP
jgi:hypothetical protein